MKYNVQLHTGSFSHSNVTSEEAVSQLIKVLDRIPVDTVIWGWSSEKALNRAISDTLKKYKCQSYLWLPVFSEIPEDVNTDPYIPLFEQEKSGIELSADEHFEFVCPSSQKNLDNALNMAAAIIKNNYVTGVFMDRIRYPSVANSVGAFAGCMCENCRSVYRQYGVDIDRLEVLLKQGNTENSFNPYGVDNCRYLFEDRTVNSLFRAKRRIINDAVAYLSDRIHSMGLKVGIDTFAPALADFVGQDLLTLADYVDLMKPMFYTKTTAPAGIPFEAGSIEKYLDLKKETLDHLWGCILDDPMAIACQLEPLRGKIELVAPGIEANSIPGICNSNEDYVLQSRSVVEQLGMKSMTLSWNISLISDKLFDILQTIEQ